MIAAESDRDDQPLLLLDDPVSAAQDAWVVLIVDDEPAIHEVTTLVLSGLQFRGRRLRFLNAYDGEQARRLLGPVSYTHLTLPTSDLV